MCQGLSELPEVGPGRAKNTAIKGLGLVRCVRRKIEELNVILKGGELECL